MTSYLVPANIPEPETIVLLGLVLVAFAAYGLYRRKKKSSKDRWYDHYFSVSRPLASLARAHRGHKGRAAEVGIEQETEGEFFFDFPVRGRTIKTVSHFLARWLSRYAAKINGSVCDYFARSAMRCEEFSPHVFPLRTLAKGAWDQSSALLCGLEGSRFSARLGVRQAFTVLEVKNLMSRAKAIPHRWCRKFDWHEIDNPSRYIQKMGTYEKLLTNILRGTSDADIPFAGIRRLMEKLGFDERIRGDHHIFTRDDVEEILNLQPRGSKAKPYQVKQVRNVVLRYKLTLEETNGK
jgi:hypothetical protein